MMSLPIPTAWTCTIRAVADIKVGCNWIREGKQMVLFTPWKRNGWQPPLHCHCCAPVSYPAVPFPSTATFHPSPKALQTRDITTQPPAMWCQSTAKHLREPLQLFDWCQRLAKKICGSVEKKDWYYLIDCGLGATWEAMCLPVTPIILHLNFPLIFPIPIYCYFIGKNHR